MKILFDQKTVQFVTEGQLACTVHKYVCMQEYVKILNFNLIRVLAYWPKCVNSVDKQKSSIGRARF